MYVVKVFPLTLGQKMLFINKEGSCLYLTLMLIEPSWLCRFHTIQLPRFSALEVREISDIAPLLQK